MSATVSNGAAKLRVASSAGGGPRRLARHRREYDRRRRALSSEPGERQAFEQMRRMVQADPCSLQIVPECHEQIAADHIVPLDDGGVNEAGNLTSACRACNAAKKRKSLLHALLDRKA